MYMTVHGLIQTLHNAYVMDKLTQLLSNFYYYQVKNIDQVCKIPTENFTYSV